MCITAFRQKVGGARQSEGSYFSFFVVFGNYPPASDDVQGPKCNEEAKLYCELKSCDLCRVIGLLFTLAAN